MKRILNLMMAAVMATAISTLFTSCGGDDPEPVVTPGQGGGNNPGNNGGNGNDEPGDLFVKGADVSWLTQLESEGYTFNDGSGRTMECMSLLRDRCGVNAIRLRVWVNPADGWNNKADLLVKARRAHALGLRLMVDFHFSDTWADPAAQTIPALWSKTDAEAVKRSMAAHVTDVLSALKAEGITPEWVQVGNETCNGMLWPLGQLDVDGNHFAEFVTAGHDAVKAVFPQAQVIVHTDQGDNPGRYDWVYGELQRKGARYDMIGVSFYPELDWDKGWLDLTESQKVGQLMSNLQSACRTYGKRAMIVEFGMDYSRAADTKAILSDLMNRCRSTDFVDGIFYWEPEAPAGYNGGYRKGCFSGGAPTVALDPFRD